MKYYSVDKHTDLFDREVDLETYKRLYAASETEHSGHAVQVHEMIIAVDEDDNRTFCIYRIGDTWTSVPAAFKSMTVCLKEEAAQ
jgi:hypothetical protein